MMKIYLILFSLLLVCGCGGEKFPQSSPEEMQEMKSEINKFLISPEGQEIPQEAKEILRNIK